MAEKQIYDTYVPEKQVLKALSAGIMHFKNTKNYYKFEILSNTW
jgi:hypothetical protein